MHMFCKIIDSLDEITIDFSAKPDPEQLFFDKRLTIAKEFVAAGNIDQAITYIERSIELGKDLKKTKELVLYELDLYLQRHVETQNTGYLHSGLNLINSYREQNPNDHDLLFASTIYYLKLEKYEYAKQCLDWYKEGYGASVIIILIELMLYALWIRSVVANDQKHNELLLKYNGIRTYAKDKECQDISDHEQFLLQIPQLLVTLSVDRQEPILLNAFLKARIEKDQRAYPSLMELKEHYKKNGYHYLTAQTLIMIVDAALGKNKKHLIIELAQALFDIYPMDTLEPYIIDLREDPEMLRAIPEIFAALFLRRASFRNIDSMAYSKQMLYQLIRYAPECKEAYTSILDINTYLSLQYSDLPTLKRILDESSTVLEQVKILFPDDPDVLSAEKRHKVNYQEIESINL